jgi:hypothetical protein
MIIDQSFPRLFSPLTVDEREGGEVRKVGRNAREGRREGGEGSTALSPLVSYVCLSPLLVS